MKVDFYKLDRNGRDTKAGSITWNGNRFIVTPKSLSNILDEEILDLGTMKGVTSKEDPERWLSNLYAHYKSAYFRASKINTSEGDKKWESL